MTILTEKKKKDIAHRVVENEIIFNTLVSELPMTESLLKLTERFDENVAEICFAIGGFDYSMSIVESVDRREKIIFGNN